MPVDHDRKLLFIHIPKTGGTTILTLLGLWKKERSASLHTLFGDFGSVDLQHLTLAQAEQFLTPTESASYLKFSFVRNPWDRAVSAAWWRTRFPDQGIRDLRDYVDWAERVNRRGRSHPWDVHALPQSSFVELEGGRVGVGRIGRFENFEHDLEMILGRVLRMPHPLPHKLQQPGRRHYRDYYRGDLALRVGRLFAKDVDRFGYTF
jgi:hypothetical protein